MKAICCIALSPALQRMLDFDTVRLGEVNRAQSLRLSSAGKGVNVAQVLKTLGDQPLLIGFTGGPEGAFIAADMQFRGIECAWVPSRWPTRQCHTLLERQSGRVSELVEEAHAPEPDEWQSLLRSVEQNLPRCSHLGISGALPPGLGADTYLQFVARAHRLGVPCVLDSQKEPLLAALAGRPLLAKLNAHELENTLGQPVRGSDELLAGARHLLQAGAENVLITQGAQPVWLVSRTEARRFFPPHIRPVNPIGSGDAMTAGILHGLAGGLSIVESVRFGVACGTANALTATPGQVHRETVQSLYGEVRDEF